MIKAIKRGSLHLSKRLGLFGGIRNSSWRRERLLILCYHSVSLDDEHEWDPGLSMSPADFEARLRALREAGCAVLALGEAIERLRQRSLPPRSVTITFDDGAYGTYSKASPLLRAYGYPATVYLTTYYSDVSKPVFAPFCAYLLWKARGRMLPPATIRGVSEALDLRTADGRAQALAALSRHADGNRLSTAGKDELADELGAALGIDISELRSRRLLQLMNASEVAEVSRSGMDVQLHTHRHRAPLEESLFRQEIRDNAQRIRAITGVAPVHFCYPSGVHRPEFLPWLAAEGVVSATTCEPGMASPDTHPLLLPRVVDHVQLASVEFESWLAGFGALLPSNPYRRDESPFRAVATTAAGR